MSSAGGARGPAVGVGGSTAQSERLERLERSARFWMRAYPRRWRVARGEELLGVLLDLAAPGARRVGARTAIDLVRGGWATRWREHPPLLPWLGYRALNRRLPEPYRAWAKDDIDGAYYAPRELLGATWAYVALMEIFTRVPGRAVPTLGRVEQFMAVWIGMAVLTWLFRSGHRRRRALLIHLAPRPGDLLYEGRLVVQDGPRARIGARSGLPWLAGASALLLMSAVLAAALAPLGVWGHPTPAGPDTSAGLTTGVGPVAVRASAYAVVLLGGLLSVLAVRRVRRWVRRPVDQPSRLLRPMGVLDAVRAVLLTSGGLGVAWLEIVGGLPLLLSPLIAAVALVVLTTAVAARAELRSDPALEIALVDVLRIVQRNRPPEVDGPVPELGPLTGPVPGGLVAPPQVLGGPRYPVLPV